MAVTQEKVIEEHISIPHPANANYTIIDNELALEAMFDNIIVKEDKFRTGFECKKCDGEGTTTAQCNTCLGKKQVEARRTCASCGGNGKVPSVVSGGSMRNCADCEGEGKVGTGEGLIPCPDCRVVNNFGEMVPSGKIPCKNCKGIGGTIVVPESVKNRPTSGVVVSTGSTVKYLQRGDRVLFTNHAGHLTNFKGTSIIRVLHEHEILMRLHGVGSAKVGEKIEY